MRSLLQILILSILSLPLVVSGVPTPDGNSGDSTAGRAMGIDVGSKRKDINWDIMRARGYLFAYIIATQGTS